MMNNAFYSILKAFFVLEIFTFLSDSFGYEGKRLDKKTKVNFTKMSQTGTQTITINILPDISKNNGNEIMKLGHLKEYFIRKSFL